MNNDFWNHQRVLITGSNSFLGRWAARALAATPAALTLADSTIPNPNSIFIERPTIDAEGLALDLLDQNATRAALEHIKPNIVLHLDNRTSIADAFDDPDAAFRHNPAHTHNLLCALRDFNDANPATLLATVQASSTQVYGLQAQTPTPEAAPLNARRIGPATEAAADILARAHAESFGLPLTVARIAHTFGGDDPNERSLVTDCINHALHGEAPLLKGSGLDAAQFLHIDDAINAILTLAIRTAEDPEINASAFNIAPDEPITFLELARRVLRRAGRPDIDPLVHDPTAPPHTEHVDNTDAKRILRWKPRLTLDQGIEEALTWYAARTTSRAA